MPGEDLLVVGRIIRPHGIRGAVIVGVETDWPERFHAGAVLVLEIAPDACEDVTLVSATPHKGGMLVYLAGVTDRDQAERLKGRYLLVRAGDASPLGEGEHWAHDLVGMKVVEQDGSPLGEVEDVLCREVQDLLVVRDADGGEFQVPFVEEFIKRVDEAGRVITVRLIEGMVP